MLADTDDQAMMLGIEPDAPGIPMSRLAAMHADALAEWTEEYARPDACRYVMRLVPEGPLLELVGEIGHAATTEARR